MEVKLKRAFLELACQLSPENLTCDGELTAQQVSAKRQKIMQEWSRLEKEAAQKVSEMEPWSWLAEVRAIEKAELSKDCPEGYEHPVPHSWVHNSGLFHIKASTTLSFKGAELSIVIDSPEKRTYKPCLNLGYPNRDYPEFETLEEAAAEAINCLKGHKPEEHEKALKYSEKREVARTFLLEIMNDKTAQ